MALGDCVATGPRGRRRRRQHGRSTCCVGLGRRCLSDGSHCGEYCFVAQTVTLAGERYERNSFSFTALIVLRRSATRATGHDEQAYARVAVGLVRRLAVGEDETQFMSRRENKRGRLGAVLGEVFAQLECTGRCSALIGRRAALCPSETLDESSGLMVSLLVEEGRAAVPLDAVGEGAVPRIRTDQTVLARLVAPDLALSSVVACTDGERTVAEIAEMSQVHVGLARRAVCDLV